MLQIRVIPVLLLRGQGLVKTERFKKERYVGDAVNAIKIFNEKEVDELIILDIESGKGGGEISYGLISDFASEAFMPLCYGGGVDTLQKMEKLFKLGIEKISVNTAATRNTDLLTKAASVFGSQSIVASVDYKQSLLGRRTIYRNRGTEKVDIPFREYLLRAQEAGAGEILLNSIDRDGTMGGYDLEAVREASSVLDVPLIACGGAGSLADFREAIGHGASAVAAGAFFVFYGKHRAVLITYPNRAELEAAMNGIYTTRES